MSMELTILMELTIAGNNHVAVREMLPAIIQRVKHDEPGIISYRWYLNEDEGKCFVIEEFENATAWLAHQARMEELMPRVFAIAPLTRYEAFGHVPQDTRDIMEALGVVIHLPVAGFKK